MLDLESTNVLTLCEALEIAHRVVKREMYKSTATLEKRERLRTIEEILTMNLDEEGCDYKPL